MNRKNKFAFILQSLCILLTFEPYSCYYPRPSPPTFPSEIPAEIIDVPEGYNPYNPYPTAPWSSNFNTYTSGFPRYGGSFRSVPFGSSVQTFRSGFDGFHDRFPAPPPIPYGHPRIPVHNPILAPRPEIRPPQPIGFGGHVGSYNFPGHGFPNFPAFSRPAPFYPGFYRGEFGPGFEPFPPQPNYPSHSGPTKIIDVVASITKPTIIQSGEEVTSETKGCSPFQFCVEPISSSEHFNTGSYNSGPKITVTQEKSSHVSTNVVTHKPIITSSTIHGKPMTTSITRVFNTNPEESPLVVIKQTQADTEQQQVEDNSHKNEQENEEEEYTVAEAVEDNVTEKQPEVDDVENENIEIDTTTAFDYGHLINSRFKNSEERQPEVYEPTDNEDLSENEIKDEHSIDAKDELVPSVTSWFSKW